jgi:hypothetical protein
MIRRLLATTCLALALPAAAQSVPATNYTDMWWNAAESGWGISFAQHAPPSNNAYAVWYTYDPRAVDVSGQFKPLWIVMPGGTWTTPTNFTGHVYVLNGVPFNQPGSQRSLNDVGTFTFTFSDASNGTFTYSIAAPAGIPSSDPAFGLPSMSGSKAITRNSF